MKIYVIGLGPGGMEEITPRALNAIEKSNVIAGYTFYIKQIEHLITEKTVVSTAMMGEIERCRQAVEYAGKGNIVSVVSSGDAGVYGMASLIYELAEDKPEIDIEVIPGITAASSSSAILGAPINHDFAVISLSDLLTDWTVIEKRLHAAGDGDFAICLYNPGSKKRSDYLEKATAIILKYRNPQTPCGVVRNAGRPDSSMKVLTLGELLTLKVDMFTTVVIGNSNTRVINGKIVTPRGYEV